MHRPVHRPPAVPLATMTTTMMMTIAMATTTLPPSVRHAEFPQAPSDPPAPASSVRSAEVLASLSSPSAPSPSERSARLFTAPSASRAAPSSLAADQPSALRTPVSFLPQFKWAGPDRFYIEPVSRSTLARFTLTPDAARCTKVTGVRWSTRGYAPLRVAGQLRAESQPAGAGKSATKLVPRRYHTGACRQRSQLSVRIQ